MADFSVMRFRALMSAVLVFAAGCGNGDSSDTSAPATSTQSAEPTCESFDGQPTHQVANWFNDGNPCSREIGLDSRETSFVGVGSWDCDDGTTLWWNDVGWGPDPGTWTFEDDDGLPPDDVLAGCRPS